MTTAYTSLLGLALPVTGELSGTWGDTVNDYITQYLDSSVAGTQTISGSQTAVTLSKTTNAALTQVGSGATGSAQYNIINCTGNPASLLTITAPASSKTYLIINATSTSQSVKIVGTGPTTGVTLIAGEKAVIAWNGSDFIKVATTAAAGGSNTQVQFNSSGVLAGSANLTFDGTNLTLGGGTANGIAYLNGSKVLTTGSALSFDGTRLTSITGKFGVGAASNSATLMVNNLNGSATGIQLFQDGVESWIMGMPASSAALTWANSGVEQMRLTSTGLGIGTSSPATQFVVSNGGAQGVEITGSNGSIQVYNRSTSAYGTMNLFANTLFFRTGVSPAINMALDSSGNLGIGTSSPGNRLHISGSGDISRFTNGTVSLYGYSDSQGLGWFTGAGGTGTGVYYNNLNSYQGFYTGGSERMRLDTSGNLGLGTTSIAYATAGRVEFDINGSSSSGIALKAGNTVYGYLGGSASGFEVNSPGALPIQFFANGSERARITSGGQLLVGATATGTGSNSARIYGYGRNDLHNGAAIYGYQALAAYPGVATTRYGVRGEVFGYGSGNNYGVYGYAVDDAISTTPSYGVYGEAGTSVYGQGYGLYGKATHSADAVTGAAYGLYATVGVTSTGNQCTTYGAYIANTATAGATAYGLYVNSATGATTTVPFAVAVGGTERARITSGGNLLVGTTTGNGRLSVLAPADGSASCALLDTSLAATAYAEFKSQGATYGYIGSGAALVSTGASTQLAIRSESSLLFSTGTTERARITSGGDFGIGLNPVANNGILQVAGHASVQALLEKATVSATAATGTINFDVLTQAVLYYTTNASANWTVNVRGSGGTSLNTIMQTGQSVTLAFLVTQGATAYYNNAFQVDGTSVTPKWQGGTAPTSGNASGIDAYVYTIIKTASATFTVLASQTQFK